MRGQDMIELYTLLLLFVFLLVSLATDTVLPLPIRHWPIAWQTSVVLLAFLLIYLIGLPLFNIVNRRRSENNVVRLSSMGSLAWPGHAILAVLSLVGMRLFVERPVAN